MSHTEFWLTVRKRRNLCILWWISWIPVGITSVGLWRFAFSSQASLAYLVCVQFVWFAAWGFTILRLRGLYCPHCGNHAIEHPFFFMKHAKCRSCGLVRNEI